MTTQEMVILRGLPASGKSTFACNWVLEDPENRVRINRDALRKEAVGMKYWGLTGKQENTVTAFQVAMVQTAVDSGMSPIVDDTNLKADTVKFWLSIAHQLGIPARIVDIDTPLQECIERDEYRSKKVGEEVIRKFYNKYYKKDRMPAKPVFTPKTAIPASFVGRAWTPNPELPKAIWVDIDGTLAERVHPLAPQPVRGPFEESRVGEDAVIEHIAELVRLLHAGGYKIVIMSGRTDACQEATERWLIENNIPYDDIFMRRTVEDHGRRDNLVKHDLFWANVAPKYNVVYALDDRQQVVDFTREVLQIPVLQVAPGNF